jgi:hypothetical protein
MNDPLRPTNDRLKGLYVTHDGINSHESDETW